VARSPFFVVALLAALFATPDSLRPQDRSKPVAAGVSREAYERWMTELSNAGRWGRDDQLGTLNLITPEVRRRAAQSVRHGEVVSLARELVPGPDPNAIRPLELRYTVSNEDSVVTWTVDQTTLLYHGWAYSHVDALSHTGYRGRLYNQVSKDALTATGATRLGIEVMRSGIVGRGVLVDVPRLRGAQYLQPGTAITAAEIERWEQQHGVRVQSGDILLIRTGRAPRVQAEGEWQVTSGSAGPHPSLAVWLKSRGVAVLGSDVSNEIYPPVVPGLSDPLHQLALVALGMPLLDNLDLEAVAREAAARSRWTFLFVAGPLPIRGASGSPLNPIAMF